MFRMLSVLAVAAFVATSSLAQDKAASEKMEMKGYLVDAMCAGGMAKKDDPMKMASMHKTSCALEEECANSGFGVFSDGKYYKFDEAGDAMAMKLLKGTKTEKGLMVVVEGTMKDGRLAVSEVEEEGMQDEESDD